MSPRVATATTTSCRCSQQTRSRRITRSPENQVLRRSARLAKRSLGQTRQDEVFRNRTLFPRKDSHECSTIPTKIPPVKPVITTNKPYPSYPRPGPFIDDSTSESDSPSSSSLHHSYCSSNTEPDSEDETKHLSATNLPFAAPAVVNNRRESHDSMYEAENENYKIDWFVVGDEDDEKTAKTDRKSSVDSTSSEDTLFVSEIKVKKRKRLAGGQNPTGLGESAAGTLQSALRSKTWSPEEVAEYIEDAIVLFSRRCNRYRKLVVLRITRDVMGDGEVREVLDRAVRLGFGVGTEMSDGSVVCRVGPEL